MPFTDPEIVSSPMAIGQNSHTSTCDEIHEDVDDYVVIVAMQLLCSTVCYNNRCGCSSVAIALGPIDRHRPFLEVVRPECLGKSSGFLRKNLIKQLCCDVQGKRPLSTMRSYVIGKSRSIWIGNSGALMFPII